MVLPGFFERGLHALTQYPLAGLCWSDPCTFEEKTGLLNKNELHLSATTTYFAPNELVELLRRGYINTLISGHPAIVSRAALIAAVALRPELRWHSDFFALLVVALRHGLCYVPGCFTVARMRSDSYMRVGTRQWPIQRKVLEHMLDIAQSPSYRDVLPMIKQSAVFSFFYFAMLRVILSNPSYWEFLSLRLIRNALWKSTKLGIAANVPTSMVRAYYRVRAAYRRAVRGTYRLDLG
jgi:hypothetical protein